MSYPDWKQLSFLFLCLTVCSDLMAAPAVVDSRFKPALDPAPAAATAWMAPNGKVVVSGTFDHINSGLVRPFARLNGDGSVDPGFSSVLGSRISPSLLAFTPSGGMIVVGYSLPNRIDYPFFRLRNDGTFDPSFKPGSSALWPFVIAVQSDGKVLSYGLANYSDYGPTPVLQRLNTDGTIDETFGTDVSSLWVESMVPLPDGKLLLSAGSFLPEYDNPPRLIRLNGDGSVDGSFNYANTSRRVDAMTPSAGGQIAILRRVDQTTVVERLNSDGTVDPTFHCAPLPSILTGCVAAQSDGRIIVGSLRFCGRLNVDGSVDTTFMAPSDMDLIQKIYVTPKDKIILNGWLTDRSVGRLSLLRLNPDGTRDRTFAPRIEGPARPTFVKALSSGKILIAGQITSVEGVPRHNLARLDASGALDRTFQPALPYLLTAPPAYGYSYGSSNDRRVLFNDRGDTLILASSNYLVGRNGAVRSNLGWLPMALEPDGSILGATHSSLLYRLSPTGNYDPDISGNCAMVFSAISSVATGNNGRIYVKGWDLASGNERSYRLNHDGTLDQSFNFPAGFSRLECQRNDGKVYVRLFPNTIVQPLYRLNADGTIDPTFKPFQESSSSAIVDKRGRLYVCGYFPFPGDNWMGSPTGVLRLLEDGSVDKSFRLYTNGDVTDMSFLPDGRLVVVGNFTYMNGKVQKNIACVFPDGGGTTNDFSINLPPLIEQN